RFSRLVKKGAIRFAGEHGRLRATRARGKRARTKLTLRNAHAERFADGVISEIPGTRMARRREAPLRERDSRLLHYRPSAQQILRRAETLRQRHHRYASSTC